MKTIVIYTPTWHAFGGGEKFMMTLAESLSQIPDTTVIMVSDHGELQKSSLEKFSGTDLSKIEYRLIQHSGELDKITSDADLFIYLSTFKPVKASAKRIVQVLQIPYGKINPATIGRKIISGQVKEAVKDLYRLQLHTHARQQASLILVYSKFVREVLSRNYHIDGKVLYPPIQDYARSGISKKNIILSVGRIFRGLYNDKRYDVLTEAFRNGCKKELNGWEYHIVGSVSSDQATQDFLQSLKDVNKDYPVYFHVNESYDSVVRLYNEASIFWHAAGYGVDVDVHPENVEHFGMTTVEAMSAGCVPVVIDKGGQREIITDTVDGFLWDKIDELIARTSDIINGRCEIENLRIKARKRYEDFNLNHFQERVRELFLPLLK